MATRRFLSSRWRFATALGVLVWLAACSTPPLPPPDSNRAAVLDLPAEPVALPARLAGAHFLVEVPRENREPWRFLVDTGSSVTLVSGDFARRYALNARRFTHAPKRVRSVTGKESNYDSVLLKQIKLGEATFTHVPALVFDPSELSAHLGVKIDGILGFPFFQGTCFTLDYLQRQLRVERPPAQPDAAAEAYTERYRTPRIGIQLGTTTAEALLDSGSDAALVLPSLDPALTLAVAPRSGGTVGGLIGSMTSQVARLDGNIKVGAYLLPQPAVTLGAPHVALGAEILGQFAVRFDTQHQQVSFLPREGGAAPAHPWRHTGLSFDKKPSYWRVDAVLPGSPAETAGLRTGDLVVRIEGEPVAKWPLDRFLDHVRQRERIVFTLLHGSRETPVVVAIYELLPLRDGAPR